MINKEIEKVIIDVCLKIGKRGEGAIIVVGNVKYNPMVTQLITPFNIKDNPKLLESLALMDGAVVIDKMGMITAYGVKLQSGNLIMRNFGTRHSAALNSSIPDENTVFIVSEEDRKVKIFSRGRMIMELDPLAKGIEKKTTEISKILESVGIGTLSVIGTSILAPFVGIVIVSGITIFVTTTGISYFIKKVIQGGWFK